jgi:serine/threonine-protein kinase RsbW
MPAVEGEPDTPIHAALDEHLDELYDEAPCGYLSTLPDGRIVKVNQTFLDWTGFSRGELVAGRRFAELLSVGGRIYHETHFAPLLAMQGEVQEIALDIRCPDRRRLPVFVNAKVKRDADGRPLLIRTTIFKAADRKRYEQELLHARTSARTERARVAKLQRLTAAFVGRRRAAEIAQVLAAELADVHGITAAEVTVSPGPGEPALVVREPVGEPGDPPPVRLRIALEQHGRRFGELALRAPEPLTLDAGARSLVEACAQLAAQALERDALHERTAEVALALQRSMLEPVDLAAAPIRVGTCYRPSEDALVVGGDWHDIFPLAPDRVGVVVGDVVGRGIDAAAVMGQLRSASRALALAHDGSADRVIAGLDEFAVHLPRALATTLVYAELDLAAGTVTYACAGHPPPLLAGPTGVEVLWGARSTPIGVPTAAGPREAATVDLAPGARLILYTDGLIERRGESLDDGIDRLTNAVTHHAYLDPQDLVDTLADELTKDEQRRDDVCLACLERRGGHEGRPGR